MYKVIIICLFLISLSCNQKTICPKCLETNCIYQQINDNVKGEGTDQEIYNSIMEVCRKRNIKDKKTIELLMKEYYL